MKPATHDFDVITDTPAPQRRKPEVTEKAPQPDAQQERSSGQRFAQPDETEHVKIQAAS